MSLTYYFLIEEIDIFLCYYFLFSVLVWFMVLNSYVKPISMFCFGVVYGDRDVFLTILINVHLENIHKKHVNNETRCKLKLVNRVQCASQ